MKIVNHVGEQLMTSEKEELLGTWVDQKHKTNKKKVYLLVFIAATFLETYTEYQVCMAYLQSLD